MFVDEKTLTASKTFVRMLTLSHSVDVEMASFNVLRTKV
jgi:hypothetical protein